MMLERMIAVVGVICVGTGSLAGDLDPPAGPVDSTFKTIEETPTSRPIGELYTPGDADATFVILESGRYHLTSDVIGEEGKAGIRIDAESALIDLNGHAVDGQGLGTLGITAVAFDQVTITDGVVRDWTGHGINLTQPPGGTLQEAVYVSRVKCVNNGGNGALISASGVVSDCEFTRNAEDGLDLTLGTVRDSTATINTGDGFEISLGRIVGSYTRLNSGFGVNAVTRVVVERNQVLSNGLGGVRAGTFSRIDSNHFHRNGQDAMDPFPEGAAIVAGVTENVIVNNTAVGNDVFDVFVGLEADRPFPTRLTILNNHISSGVLIDFSPASSTIGPVVTPANVATNTNPHANYVTP